MFNFFNLIVCMCFPKRLMSLFIISDKEIHRYFCYIFRIVKTYLYAPLKLEKEMARIITQLLLQVYIIINGGVKMNHLFKKNSTFLLTVTDENYEK